MEPVPNGNVTRIKTDAELAAEVRAELTDLLQMVCRVMDKARAAGLDINFGLGIDDRGRQRIMKLDIVKPL